MSYKHPLTPKSPARLTAAFAIISLTSVLLTTSALADTASSRIPSPNAAARTAGLDPAHGATPGWSQQVDPSPLGAHGDWSVDLGGGGSAPRNPPHALPGLDVPPSNTALDWSAYAAAGYRFAFIKASEGTYYVNPNFAVQRSAATAQQLRLGTYHFANPKGSDGARQAAAFVEAGGGWSPGRLPGVLDIEDNPYSGSSCYDLDAATMVAWIGSFLERYRQLTGVDALLYTTHTWWQRCTADSAAFADTNPLWLARWADTPGQLPAGYTSWMFWQSGNDDPAGVDYNAFHGTQEQLDAYAASPVAPHALRLAGRDRIETSVAVSQRQFPTSFRGRKGSVYLARSDVLVDAMAAGSLTDGPILMVPSCGTVPAVVAAEVTRLQPARVVALGGEGAVCSKTLTSVSRSLPTARLGGIDRGATSRTIATERQRQRPLKTVYLASDADSSPDAIAGGQLDDGPVLLVPGTTPVSSQVTEAIRSLGPATITALGGEGAVSRQTLESAAGALPAYRIGGADRFETAALIARRAFPGMSTVAYLASGEVFADAVSAGVADDGALILVPTCSQVPSAVATTLKALRPQSIIPLGGEGAVCASVSRQAIGKAR